MPKLTDPVKNIVVHKFRLGDVDDPGIYAAQPLYEWEHSPAGKWVMEHAIEPPTLFQGPTHWGFEVRVEAKLKESDLVYYYLKYS